MSSTGYTYELARTTVTIPQSNWTKEGELWTCAVQHSSIQTDTDVDIVLEEESIGVPLCSMVKPENGRVKLYAYAPPGEDIRVTIKVTEIDGLTGNGKVYTTAGSANAYTVTIPDFAPGKTYLIRFHAATSSATVNINANGLGNVRLYGYGTSGVASGHIAANQIARVLYSDISGTAAFYYLNYQNVSSVTSSTYASYGIMGAATYVAATGGRLSKWLPFGTLTLTYNATYNYGHSGQIVIGLEEIQRNPSLTDAISLENMKVIIRYVMKSATSTTLFVSEQPSFDIAVDGKYGETLPQDIVAVLTSNTATSKIITFYVRAKSDDKIFYLNPERRYGRAFSATASSSSYDTFTYTSNGAPIDTLPTPVQGAVVIGQAAK